jgi:hypothetical protein
MFLIFQTDSIVISEHKDLINDFLEYDYVGAPWGLHGQFALRVGNGGLSLRRKSKMLEIIKRKGYQYGNEDLYFIDKIDSDIEYKIPTWEKAMFFSVEQVFNDKMFGVHNCWKTMDMSKVNELITKYNDIKKLIDLQGWEKD